LPLSADGSCAARCCHVARAQGLGRVKCVAVVIFKAVMLAPLCQARPARALTQRHTQRTHSREMRK
jgi:hypothetical protein